MPTTKGLTVDVSPTDRPRVAGTLADEHVAVLVSTLGARLNRGATAYYRSTWNIGTVEWRLLMTLNSIEALNVSELSDAAYVDKAAASRSLVLLEERGLVSVEQTRSRGRAAIARLTAEGRAFAAKLAEVSGARDARLFKDFAPADKEQLRHCLLYTSDAADE